MSEKIFTASSEMKPEYCAQIVRIGELWPIEGSDFLVQTLVGGHSMVIRKDEFKTGDYAIYCKNETALNADFLSKNNLFEISEYKRNENAPIVDSIKEQIASLSAKQIHKEEDLTKSQELEARIKNMCGFFNKYGRVKMIRLRGIPSFGFIIKLDDIAKWMPQVKKVDLSKYILNDEMGIGIDFDTICGEKFIKVYMPPIKEQPVRKYDKQDKNRQKKIKRFERINERDFVFHYTTKQLNDNIWRIKPTDKVTIDCKLHGTSVVIANIPVKIPIKLSWINIFVNWLHKKSLQFTNWLSTKTKPDYKTEYGNVYSSRAVIKNQYINKNVTSGFYKTDVWGVFNEIVSPYIEQGMTIYGEICGYLPDSDKMIQKGYDYGCKRGESFLMPYRITTTNEDGSKKEWEVNEVREWTVNLINNHPELKEKIHPIDIFYEGTLSDLYPDIPLTQHWHENVLEKMKNDKEHFGMELNEPLCKTKVPREGICIRLFNDPTPETFKLKCFKFYEKEKAAIDKCEVDVEMDNAYNS